jgi:peptide/nickel transport system permease protein
MTASGATPRVRGRAGRAWATLRHHPVGLVALGYLIVLTSAVVAAPAIAPYDPTAIDLDHVLSGPTAQHPLGADALGRDVLSRLMYAGQISLWGVAQAVVAVLVLGVPFGLAAGFYAGWFDRAVTVVADVVLAIPVVVTLLVVLAVFGSSQTAAMLALGALGAPGLARVVRGATLAVVGEPWVAVARVTGLTNTRILVRHLLPRVAGPIIVQTSIFAGVALIAETGLAYLGLGVQPPTPTWGGMVAEASTVIDRQGWLLVPTGAVIGLTVVAWGLLGDLVRDTAVERVPRRRPMPRSSRARALTRHVGPPATTPAPLLSVRGLTVQVMTADGPSTVVEDAWLDIRRGETVGLVGESGCGKSVTGRAILGLLPLGARITAGSVLFDGRDLALDSPGALAPIRGTEIALISQQSSASLDPCFTIGAQVAEMVGRRVGARQAVRTRVHELLTSVNLPDPDGVARRYPHELSGGMAQRVAIAMALAKGPRLLIADEPTTALDGTIQAEILDLLRGLQERSGMSILMITHDWGVVADICTRSYVMYAGHVMESADTTVLMGQSRHPYTLGLLGSMVQGAQPRQRLPAIGGTVPDPRDWPHGCHFQPRCPFAVDECASAPVPVFEPEPDHYTRCLRHEAIRREGEDELVRGAA